MCAGAAEGEGVAIGVILIGAARKGQSLFCNIINSAMPRLSSGLNTTTCMKGYPELDDPRKPSCIRAKNKTI